MKKSLLFLILLLGVSSERGLAKHKHPSKEAIEQARLDGRTCVPLSDFIKLAQSGDGKTLKMYRTDCTVIAPARDGKPAVIQCVAHDRRVKHALGLTRHYASSSQALNLTASDDSNLGSMATLLPSDATLSAGDSSPVESFFNEASFIFAEGLKLKGKETVGGLATQVYDTLMSAYDKATESGKTVQEALASAKAALAHAYPSETPASIEATFASAEASVKQASIETAQAVPEIAQVSGPVADAAGQDAAKTAVTQLEAAMKQVDATGQVGPVSNQRKIDVGKVVEASVGAAVGTVVATNIVTGSVEAILISNAADTLGISVIIGGIMAAAMACSIRIQHPPVASIAFCPAIDGINPDQYSLCVHYHKKRGIMGKFNIYFDRYSIQGPQTDQMKKNLADAKAKVEQLKKQLAQAQTDDARFPIKEQLKQATERLGYLSNSAIAVIPNAITIEKQQLDDISTELKRKLMLASKLRSVVKKSQDASDLDITIKALERLVGEVDKKRKALSAQINSNLQSFLLEGQEKLVQEGVQYQTDQQALKKKEADEKAAAAKAALEAALAKEKATNDLMVELIKRVSSGNKDLVARTLNEIATKKRGKNVKKGQASVALEQATIESKAELINIISGGNKDLVARTLHEIVTEQQAKNGGAAQASVATGQPLEAELIEKIFNGQVALVGQAVREVATKTNTKKHK